MTFCRHSQQKADRAEAKKMQQEAAQAKSEAEALKKTTQVWVRAVL
jgi:hypothetical protein